MTKSVQCPVCSMRIYTTACPRCGAKYEGGEWRLPSGEILWKYSNNINKDTGTQ